MSMNSAKLHFFFDFHKITIKKVDTDDIFGYKKRDSEKSLLSFC